MSMDASSNVVAEDRCVNTIHSNYVTDHRCQLRSGHEGDCLFGRAIANRVECPECEQERIDSEGEWVCPNAGDGRCPGLVTRNRVRYVHLPAWFAIEEDGRLRLCDEAEAEEARRQLREP